MVYPEIGRRPVFIPLYIPEFGTRFKGLTRSSTHLRMKETD